MKIFWKDGALNLAPETEEDGQVTSAILFAYGTEKPESHLADVVFEVRSNGIGNGTDQQPIIGVNMSLDGIVEGIPGRIEVGKPLRKENSVHTD